METLEDLVILTKHLQAKQIIEFANNYKNINLKI